MSRSKKIILPITLICIILSCLLGTPSGLFALEVTEVMVSDVTPASFCVVLLTGDDASADIALYQDTEGLYPVSSYTVIDTPCADSTIFSEAAQKGIRKIKVMDLSQDTTYYFKLTAISSEDPNITAIYPPDETLYPVTTELEARLSRSEEDLEVPLQSHLLMADFYLEDKSTPADHTLVVAQVDGASYPLSTYIGEGATTPLCVIDLHNLFCAFRHTTLAPVPGSGILFYHYKGSEQTAIRRFFLPSDLPQDEPIFPAGITQEVPLAQGLNYISFQVDPQNSEEIHAALSGKYTEMWTYEHGAWTDISLDNTHLFRPNQGYLITATEALTITAIGGWRMDPIPLDEGLNIIGYRAETPVPVEEAMAPLVGKYTRIWGYSDNQWRSYDPTLPASLNTLTEILPGKSYYLFIKESGVRW